MHCRRAPYRSWLRIVTWLVWLVWPAATPGVRAGAGAGQPDAASPPNLVFIVADDLGWAELGSYGQKKIRTPNLDRLAREGMRFTQHYSGAPVCAPSRCVLMTGLHTGHAEIRGNLQVKGPDGKPGEGQQPIAAETRTLAEALHDAGYATGAMGKWGLGPVDGGGAPHRQGFDLFFGYNCQAVAHSYYPSHLWRNRERVPLNARPVPGHARQPEGEVTWSHAAGERYAPDAMVAEAEAFLRDRRDRRFFLYLPFIEPHVALMPPRDLVESYPEDWDDRPYRGQCGYAPNPRPRASYAALISSLDRHVGRILKTLDELGLAGRTAVFFTSDNGTTHASPGDPAFGIGGVDAGFFESTGGLRGRKGSLHEGGIRVPLIVRWPGRVAAGAVTDYPCWFADHFPTLCDLAGVRVPAGLDGHSLLPLLEGRTMPAERPPMVWAFPEYGGQVAVRLGDFKVLRKDLHKPRAVGPWEVYDIARDRNETRDLAASRTDLVERARTLLREQIAPNANFPVRVPGLTDGDGGAGGQGD